MESRTKLLDQMRMALRLRHMSLRTAQVYVGWTRRFLLFHQKRHPKDMGAEEIRAFLTYLAINRRVAASTQNVAWNAVLFLSRHVLQQEFPSLDNLERAKRSRRVPTVFTREEVAAVSTEVVSKGAARVTKGGSCSGTVRLMSVGAAPQRHASQRRHQPCVLPLLLPQPPRGSRKRRGKIAFENPIRSADGGVNERGHGVG